MRGDSLTNKSILKLNKNVLKEFANIVLEPLLKCFIKPPHIMSKEETIKKIIDDRASVSRFGDGELDIILGKDLVFQPYHQELALKLKEILQFEGENFLVCLPDVFDSLEHYIPSSKDYWMFNMRRYRRKWYRNILKGKIYYNSFITRFYIIFKNKVHCDEIIRLLKLIWENRDIVFIEGEKSYLGVDNDLFDNAKSIRRILCPSVNAYKIYDRIIDEALKMDKDILFLIALGPTATVIAFDLYHLGYQAIDIGHIDIEYEWYLMKAREKTAIPNKYTHEVENGREVGVLKNVKYNDQIINRLS
jgi:glycosyltransferase family protein